MKQMRAIQTRFKLRLRKVRDLQIEEAGYRSEIRKALWEHRLAQITEQKKKLLESICPGCDCPKRIVYDWESNKSFTTCGCGTPVTCSWIVSQLRRLAGINLVPGHVVRDEFTDALKGRSGPRGCGPASWDNAVRAIEDE